MPKSGNPHAANILPTVSLVRKEKLLLKLGEITDIPEFYISLSMPCLMNYSDIFRTILSMFFFQKLSPIVSREALLHKEIWTYP